MAPEIYRFARAHTFSAVSLSRSTLFFFITVRALCAALFLAFRPFFPIRFQAFSLVQRAGELRVLYIRVPPCVSHPSKSNVDVRNIAGLRGRQ